MSIVGMPLEMFLVFAATIAAGHLAAVHYLIVHVILEQPPEENIPRLSRRNEELDTKEKAND